MLCRAPGDGELAAWHSGMWELGRSSLLCCSLGSLSSSSRPRGGDHHHLSPNRGKRRVFLTWTLYYIGFGGTLSPSCSSDFLSSQAVKERGGHKVLDIKSFSCSGTSVPSCLGLWEPPLACGHAVLWLLFPFQHLGAQVS